jgi:hypothetical protein
MALSGGPKNVIFIINLAIWNNPSVPSLKLQTPTQIMEFEAIMLKTNSFCPQHSVPL